MLTRKLKQAYRSIRCIFPRLERVYFKVVFVAGALLACFLLLGEFSGILRRVFPVFPFYQVLMMSIMLMLYGVMVGNGWPFRQTMMSSRKGYQFVVCPNCKSKNQVLVRKLDSAVCGRCRAKLR